MLINNQLSVSATQKGSNNEDVISLEQRIFQNKDGKEKSAVGPVPDADKDKVMFQMVMNDFITFTFSPDEDQELAKDW